MEARINRMEAEIKEVYAQLQRSSAGKGYPGVVRGGGCARPPTPRPVTPPPPDIPPGPPRGRRHAGPTSQALRALTFVIGPVKAVSSPYPASIVDASASSRMVVLATSL
jgi:hypothetical protein